MKRKIVAILLATMLMLSATACTEKIELDYVDENAVNTVILSERLGVPESYYNTVTTEKETTNIILDVDSITIPNVYDVDTFTITPKIYSQEEIELFVETYTEGTQASDWEYYDTSQTIATWTTWDGEIDIPLEIRSTYQAYYLWLINRNIDYALRVAYYIDADGDFAFLAPNMFFTSGTMYNGTIYDSVTALEEDNTALNCTISLEEAFAIADETASQYGDFQVNFYGQNMAIENAHPEIESDANPQYYSFYYTRTVNGIPVTYCDNSRGVGYSYDYTSSLEFMWLIVSDDGLSTFYYESPQTLGDLVEKNVELLSFDEIIDIFEQISVLDLKTYWAKDNYYASEIYINEIRFGYMAVKQANSEDYILTPVWDFYGEKNYFSESEADEYAEQEYEENTQTEDVILTIDATNGTVIDRYYGY